MPLNVGNQASTASYGSGDVATNAFNATQNTNSGEKKTEITTQVLRYPYKMIDSSTDYLEIKIAEYQPPGYANISNLISSISSSIQNIKIGNSAEVVSQINQLSAVSKEFQGKEKTQKTYKNTILLPIPQTLSDANSVGWGADSMNPLAALGTSVAGGLMENTGQTAEEILKGIQGISGLDENVRKSITATLAATLANKLSGNVSTTALISRATGQVFNPNLELLFEGPNLRSYPFNFDFAPRDSNESQIVKQIIRTLKKSMCAKQIKSGGVFISAPDVFELTYKRGNQPHPFLNKFKQMALTDIQLNYTGSGTYATYYDGTPVHITMTLSFKELNPIYAEDYDSVKEGVGY